MRTTALAMVLLFWMSCVAFATTPTTLQEHFEQLVTQQPSKTLNPTVREAAREYILARQLAGDNFHIEAIKHYRIAAELDIRSSAPWVGMAVSLAALDRDDTAILVWEEVIARDPMHKDALLILGIDAAKMGHIERGQKFLTRHWLYEDTEPLEALLRLAALLFVFESNSEIHELLTETINPIVSEAGFELSASSPSAVWLGVLQQLVDLDAVEMAIQLVVKNASILQQKELGTLMTVMPVLEAAIDGNGVQTQALYEQMSRTQMLSLSPRWSEKVSLAQALSIAAQTMTILGGDPSAPVRLYEKSLQLEPNNALALNNLAWILLQQEGPTAEVQQFSNRALELDPKAPYILDTVGRMHTMLGDYSSAIELLTLALEQTDLPSPEMYEHLGDAFWLAGEHKKGTSMWEAASTLLHTPEYRQGTLDGYASMSHSVWGIMVATPEALYDFEMGSVIRRLDEKLAALAEGKNPEFGFVVPKHGVN